MATVFIQDACINHRYIRSNDKSNIVERPERLRAVKVGIAGACGRISTNAAPHSTTPASKHDSEDLAEILAGLTIQSQPSDNVLRVVQSSATLDILNHSAVKFIHGDIDGDFYLEDLKKWSSGSWNKIGEGSSEIPPTDRKGQKLNQGDLYLCPESITAMEGALGTVCEAVDQICTGSVQQDKRAFVAIRPPGHHCGEDTPSGFCFVNNVAVAVAQAHLKHGVDRIVVLDIDLHHGNGTQSILWQINEESHRKKLEAEYAPSSETEKSLITFYGSVHDIQSFPCEDGIPSLVQAASTSIHDAHGQFIENVHLKEYTSEEQFFEELYQREYGRLLAKASQFLSTTGSAADGSNVMVFISAGFDASEHEYQSMSRHNRRVPTAFYDRFTRDACAFADKYAGGKIISVLEGGYSDRALASGTFAHLVGMTGVQGPVNDWWSLDNLQKLENIFKKRRGGRVSGTGLTKGQEEWLHKAVSSFNQDLNGNAAVPSATPPSTRTLRDRAGNKVTKDGTPNQDSNSESDPQAEGSSPQKPSKTPRVILKLGPKPES